MQVVTTPCQLQRCPPSAASSTCQTTRQADKAMACCTHSINTITPASPCIHSVPRGLHCCCKPCIVILSSGCTLLLALPSPCDRSACGMPTLTHCLSGIVWHRCTCQAQPCHTICGTQRVRVSLLAALVLWAGSSCRCSMLDGPARIAACFL